LKKLKIINFKEWIVIFWKSDKIFKKINYEGKNNGSYTIKGTQDEEET
jgi:hypothetical protein